MIRIEHCQSVTQPGWLELRQALWPGSSRQAHADEVSDLLADRQRYINLIAYSESGTPAGLAEASLRTGYVNGTESSPVVFLEGIYVTPECRRQHIAGQLIDVVAQWGRSHGCTEMASDTDLNNLLSQDMHKALGFAETERVVFFKRGL
ncbi:aminoglycoside 6'-acetyltransferase [Pseudomonas syringae]|uniref:Aminoglycoside N(6')-acetyltransferase type 1 n=1 Tax=Pseudomonas syringae TaxID=317 RepID=A0A1C7ZC68_PSESX|nr:aminoglycoside 6'-N-acetyltransferase [Pseudomonas syringae]OCR26999.1 aminoglycoside 6'-acetyltransferase [Pseudomonas syringae]